ncbi:MAG: DUF2513 domain-containing protein [Nitrosomonas sp.]|nr:MAG: DUF2513 domain-containing protein [Nitrosomonas sp.]
MKRDLDLVRSILFAMEANESGFYNQVPDIAGHTTEEVAYHIYLMGQAGLITTEETTTINCRSPSAIAMSITWAGHDFLDSVKDETLWNKAKSKVIKPATGVAFEVLVAWLKDEAKRRLGLL